MRPVLVVLALSGRRPPRLGGRRDPGPLLLPGDQVFPEGVTLRPGTDQFFVTSTHDGTIFRGRLGRARTTVFLRPGSFGRTSANGIKATRDRLVIAGSVLNRIDVVDLRTGASVRRFDTGSGGLVNDIAIAPNGDAYATDSGRGLIFRIPARLLRRRGDPVRLPAARARVRGPGARRLHERHRRREPPLPARLRHVERLPAARRPAHPAG
jgi:sugar lactone lactonase YvrE